VTEGAASVSNEIGGGASVPRAPSRPRILRHGRDERIDGWDWLRDLGAPEVRAYIDAECAYTATSLRSTARLRAAIAAEIAARAPAADVSAPVRKGAWEYYVRTVAGRPYGVHCRRRAGTPGAPGRGAFPGEPEDEAVVLDENELAAGSPHLALLRLAPSPDATRIAYVADVTGDERAVLRIRDLAAGEDLPDTVLGVSPYAAWTDAAAVLYVARNGRGRDWQVRSHRLGTAQGEDAILFEERDERFRVELHATRTGRFVLVHSVAGRANEIRLVDVGDPARAPRLLVPRQPGAEHELEHHMDGEGGRFFLRTNADGAATFKLLMAPDDHADRPAWQEVLPARADVRLNAVRAFASHLVLAETAGTVEWLRVVSLAELRSGARGRVVEASNEPHALWLGRNLDFAAASVRIRTTSLVRPIADVDHELETGAATVVKREQVPGYDPDAYESFRVWARASDGTRIPISLVRRKGLAEPAPTVLYGYGAYGTPAPLTFDAARLSLLERGVAYAIAHVRGGGELGQQWHDDGRRLHKLNSLTDFVACAEQLVAMGLTSPDRLVANGGSAGGLLVAGAANLAPRQFRAIVAEMPFVDCLTALLDPSRASTTLEWEEWGDPVHDPAAYAAIKRYSPYENVARQRYPALLVTTALNDARVPCWHALKLVAKLRAVASEGSRIYLHVEREGGHMGPSGRYAAREKAALVLGFMLDQLGLAARPRPVA
jgi:oligopeptidase B